jgi:hypothetical protein
MPGACDFWASFVIWDAPPRAEPDPRPYARHDFPHGIKVRLPLDAILEVADEATGATERIVLCTGHRTEWCFNDPPIFAVRPLYPPAPSINTEYRFAFSSTAERNMEGHPFYPAIPERRLARTYESRYRSASLDIKRLPNTRELKTAAEINAAVEARAPLVGRTEIQDPQRHERYVLEYPVRVVDYWADDLYQVNSGPILLPDFERQEEQLIDRLEMAYIAQNQKTPNDAEFIIRRYLPINDEETGKTVCWVLNYAEVRNYPARTTLLAGEDGTFRSDDQWTWKPAGR